MQTDNERVINSNQCCSLRLLAKALQRLMDSEMTYSMSRRTTKKFNRRFGNQIQSLIASPLQFDDAVVDAADDDDVQCKRAQQINPQVYFDGLR